MANVFDGHEPRVGFLRVPEWPEGQVVACTIALGPRGPVAYLPHDEEAVWTTPVSEWHREKRVPSTLYFTDNFGKIVLLGTRWTQLSGSHRSHGRVQLEASVTLMGEPAEEKRQVSVERVCSRFDGLVEFAGRRAVDLDRRTDENGRPTYVVTIAPDETTTWTYEGFEYSVRASSTWHALGDDDFSTESQAWVATSTSERATVEDHLREQRKVRSLVIFAQGRGLFWREHRVDDDLFTTAHGNQWVETFVRDLYRERALPAQKEQLFPLFRLESLDPAALERWLALHDDEALRRAIEPFADNLVERPAFVEIDVMTRAMSLDAFGHYWLGKPARSNSMYLNVEECIVRSGIDVSSLGSTRDVATAISNLNNDLKHPDRPRPDLVGLALADDLLGVLIRAQAFALLALPNVLRDQFTTSWAVAGVFSAFEANRLEVLGTGKDARFVQRP